MSWIRTVAEEDARGALARSYEAARRRAGRVFQIVRAMSLAPALLDASFAFYAQVMKAPRALSRWRRELLAVVVSRLNECHY